MSDANSSPESASMPPAPLPDGNNVLPANASGSTGSPLPAPSNASAVRSIADPAGTIVPAGAVGRTLSELEFAVRTLEPYYPKAELLGKAAEIIDRAREMDTPADEEAIRSVIFTLGKPGHKTTEFWLYAAVIAALLALAFMSGHSGDCDAFLAGLGTLAYATQRIMLKGRLAEAVATHAAQLADCVGGHSTGSGPSGGKAA